MKECYEKAEVVTSGKSTKAAKPNAAASKAANDPAAASKAPTPASSSTNVAAKKPVKKKPAGTGAVGIRCSYNSTAYLLIDILTESESVGSLAQLLFVY